MGALYWPGTEIRENLSMNKKTFARPALLATFCALAPAFSLAQAPPATLTIHPDQTLHSVSPTLYGLMTEEINYSYDGGLYAEMVRNRTFRSEWDGVHDWFLVEDGNAAAAISVDKATGPSTALPSSFKVEIKKADAHNQAGILNDGFWGMPLHPNTAYHGSFYAKAGSADLGPISVSLVSNTTGKPVATAQVAAIGADWKQYEFTLKTGAIEPSSANHLAITVNHPGTLWLNLVSLFPPTYHDRPNGYRVDLMEKLAALHPAFLRFPGGNYLEGNHIPEHFDWKKTIGPLVDRPTHPSPWGYRSSDGMGLLEFLGWCEDLHIQPVLAVYAGYSLAGEHVKAGDLEPYVQDALDEIEYVTGGPDTKWGAERVKDGHPAPFALTYVEIGNEDWLDHSGSYQERYGPFEKAIRAKYPNLKLIATAPAKGGTPDVIDEHYYVRATENFHTATHYDAPTSDAAPRWNAGRYDKADRNGPKVFVGEWATLEGSPTPNMGGALGDAAWLTGLERNSDIVIMAAYAPLFVNVDPGGMQWGTNLIGYNALRSYGSPSYYAQVLFAKYLGDQVPASKLDGVDPANPKLFYSVTRDSAKKQLYLKVVNAASTPQELDIDLPGAKLADAGKLITLSAHDTQATNSIEKPTEIVPVETELHAVGDHLHHTVPAYAIQVIQLNEK